MKFLQRGFTIIELLLVMGLFTVLVAIGAPITLNMLRTNDLDSAYQSLNSNLRTAQIYSMGVKNDQPWGVHVQNGSITVFQGASYANRNTSFDETTKISNSINTSGLQNVMFSKLTATPSATGSITLNSFGRNKTVSINSEGMIQ